MVGLVCMSLLSMEGKCLHVLGCVLERLQRDKTAKTRKYIFTFF